MNTARGRLISLFVVLALLVMAGALWVVSQKMKVIRVPILMYHKIGDATDSPWWVTIRDFEQQLRSLREEGYTSILPSELAQHQRWGRPLPNKPVIITFDDGYLSALEVAEPLLRKYDFRGVCYLITGALSESPDKRKTYDGTPLLSWPEIREMRKRGTMMFGGHTRNHPNLRAMPDPYGEILGCYKDIREKGGFRPEGFCYPYGQYKPETMSAVKRARFTTAMTCEDGVVETGKGMRPLELPRVSVMGGWRRFHVERIAGENTGRCVSVTLEGAGLQVTPRLVWPVGGADAEKQGWQDPVQLSSAPVLLTWMEPESHGSGDSVLELWDAFHVILYYRGVVSFSEVPKAGEK